MTEIKNKRNKPILRLIQCSMVALCLTNSYASSGPSYDELPYKFRTAHCADMVFHHPSKYPENRVNFGRMELLGDKVLGRTVTEILLAKYPNSDEGELSKMISELVSNKNNSRVFDRLNLLRYTKYQDGAGKLKKIKADTMEAYIGALCQDGGEEAVRQLINDNWSTMTPAPTPVIVKKIASSSNSRQELHRVLNIQQKKSHEFKVTQNYPASYEVQLLVDKKPIKKPEGVAFTGASPAEAKRKAAAYALVELQKGTLIR